MRGRREKDGRKEEEKKHLVEDENKEEFGEEEWRSKTTIIKNRIRKADK